MIKGQFTNYDRDLFNRLMERACDHTLEMRHSNYGVAIGSTVAPYFTASFGQTVAQAIFNFVKKNNL